MVREPVVAGSFYRASPEGLAKQIEDCFLSPLGPGKLAEVNPSGPGKIIGLVSPHAGYIYSGPVAAHGFYHLAQDQVPETVVILGPNHSGFGSPVAICSPGVWDTPLGGVEIDEELLAEIEALPNIISMDDSAHRTEHSIEVQLPFLQYLYRTKFQFVPICMLDQTFQASLAVGEDLAQVLAGREAVIIASTDFTHYESQKQAEQKDRQALEAIVRLKPEELARVVGELRISMCGSGPVMAMLVAATKLGAKNTEILAYHTSGDVTSDYEAVVGYASVAVRKP